MPEAAAQPGEACGYYRVTVYTPLATEIVPYTLTAARTFFQPMEMASMMITMMVLMFSIPFVLSMVAMMMQPVNPTSAAQQAQAAGGGQAQPQRGQQPLTLGLLPLLLVPPLALPFIMVGLMVASALSFPFG